MSLTGFIPLILDTLTIDPRNKNGKCEKKILLTYTSAAIDHFVIKVTLQSREVEYRVVLATIRPRSIRHAIYCFSFLHHYFTLAIKHILP